MRLEVRQRMIPLCGDDREYDRLVWCWEDGKIREGEKEVPEGFVLGLKWCLVNGQKTPLEEFKKKLEEVNLEITGAERK